MVKSRFNENLIFYILAGGLVSYLLSLFLMQVFFGVLSLLWLVEKYSEKRKAFTFLTLLFTLFVAVRLLSVILSPYPDSSIQSLYKDALFYFSFFALSFYLKSLPPDKFIKTAYIFAAGAVLASVIGIILFNLQIAARAQTFSGGYAAFSSYLITALAFQLMLPYDKENKYGWLIWPASTALIISAVILSMGRTNIAIMVILLSAALILRRFTIKTALITAIIAAAVTLISFQNNSTEMESRIENPAALSDRDIILNAAKDMALERPVIGYGPRTFHDIFPYRDQLTDKGVGSWHNDFIQVYFESGALGLITFLILLGAAWFKLAFYIKDRKEKDDLKYMAYSLLLGLTALILSALTAGFVGSPVLSVVFAYLIAASSVIVYPKADK